VEAIFARIAQWEAERRIYQFPLGDATRPIGS